MIEIPGYTILGKVGQGGMASVFRARQVLLDRDVALKVMSSQLAQDEAYAQRFLQEARMLAALNHPNVVQVYDVGVTPSGLHYFSMALLPGGDFADRMRQGLSETELLRVLVAVATALGFAHSRGYVHRDVTPGNILFDGHDTPVLTDFGIARALSAVSRLTGSGMSIGTSHYMSPEQARGGAEIDHRADIYGLGVLCYEAVAGETPFRGEDGFAVAFAHVNDPVPRLPEEVSRWQPLIDKAMSKSPADRYQNCAEFIEGLKLVAPGEFSTLRPTAAPPPPRRTPAPPTNTKRGSVGKPKPIGLIIGAVVGVLLLVAAGLWLVFGGSKPRTSALPSTAVSTPVIAPTPKPKPPVVETPVVDDLSDSVDASLVPVGEPLTDADAAAALAEAMATTVRDPVLALLEAGRANIAAGRLITPPVTNALDRYKLALVIEPDNVEAGKGIASVAQAYLDLALPQTSSEQLQAWVANIAAAEQVAAQHPAAASVLAAAGAARQARAKSLIAEGEAAIKAFNRQAAVTAFENALVAAPGLQAAQTGLATAKKVGEVGYTFSDTSKGGAIAATLVVVSKGLAVGKREVTRGEFSVYWSAAGSAKFGANLPSCRDRNSGAFFGGKKSRTWQAPDITQDASHPVVCVSYAMAEGYAAWLAAQTGKSYRLPKLAEISAYASPLVGNCKTNLRNERGCQDGHEGTAPVGSFPASGPGLLDTVGNAAEWTSDCAKGNCAERLTAGGSWYSDVGDPSSLARPADDAFNTVGFRVVREID
ncbi:MAG: bifunctional serine/threonine-protein kinase/formylglycine-generating enzyme family protein [Pseudomarimonas sp.]